MATKSIKGKHRREQDYWLLFAGSPHVTEEQREEFFRYDSLGGPPPARNPIWAGKCVHGMTGSELYSSYISKTYTGWGGGLELVRSYGIHPEFGMRSLRSWFGKKAVQRWLDALVHFTYG